METEKTISKIDERVAEKQQQKSRARQELREVDQRERGINRDFDSLLCTCAEVTNIGNAEKNTEVKSYEH
jgi:aspartate oxidase